MNRLLLLGAWTALAAGAASAQPVQDQLQNPEHADVEVVGHVVEPRQLDPTPERIAGLRLPAGFEVSVFARDLVNPRMMAVAGDGTVYVTRRTVGDVVMLRDEDGDGVADRQEVVASRPGMHGIAIDGDTVYLVAVGELYRTRILGDGTLAPLELLADDLPDLGQHPNPMVVVGPDGMLYLTMGSTCNACSDANPENATMLRAAPDGSGRTIFATGLRNTIGYGFHPETGEVFGMDHGIDWLGDNEQHEELNQIVEGAQYGWPYVYADGEYNPQDYPPGGITMPEWAARSAEPLGLYTPHAAPMQLAFYTGDAFPDEYRGDAFVAMRGSWNRRPPSGYEVVRVRFEDGRPVAFEPFVQGFLVETEDGGWGHLGRLLRARADAGRRPPPLRRHERGRLSDRLHRGLDGPPRPDDADERGRGGRTDDGGRPAHPARRTRRTGSRSTSWTPRPGSTSRRRRSRAGRRSPTSTPPRGRTSRPRSRGPPALPGPGATS